MKELVGEMIKPNTGRVLLQMIRESNEYTPGVMRLNPQAEPYMRVLAVANGVTSMVVGDLVITRNMNYEVFKLYGEEYTLVFVSDVMAVISEEISKEIKNQLTKKSEDVN